MTEPQRFSNQSSKAHTPRHQFATGCNRAAGGGSRTIHTATAITSTSTAPLPGQFLDRLRLADRGLAISRFLRAVPEDTYGIAPTDLLQRVRSGLIETVARFDDAPDEVFLPNLYASIVTLAQTIETYPQESEAFAGMILSAFSRREWQRWRNARFGTGKTGEAGGRHQ